MKAHTQPLQLPLYANIFQLILQVDSSSPRVTTSACICSTNHGPRKDLPYRWRWTQEQEERETSQYPRTIGFRQQHGRLEGGGRVAACSPWSFCRCDRSEEIKRRQFH